MFSFLGCLRTKFCFRSNKKSIDRRIFIYLHIIFSLVVAILKSLRNFIIIFIFILYYAIYLLTYVSISLLLMHHAWIYLCHPSRTFFFLQLNSWSYVFLVIKIEWIKSFIIFVSKEVVVGRRWLFSVGRREAIIHPIQIKKTNKQTTNKQTNQPTFLPNKQKEKSNKFFVLGNKQIKKTKKVGKKVLLPN